jgi:hypothetical protein
MVDLGHLDRHLPQDLLDPHFRTLNLKEGFLEADYSPFRIAFVVWHPIAVAFDRY